MCVGERLVLINEIRSGDKKYEHNKRCKTKTPVGKFEADMKFGDLEYFDINACIELMLGQRFRCSAAFTV